MRILTEIYNDKLAKLKLSADELIAAQQHNKIRNQVDAQYGVKWLKCPNTYGNCMKAWIDGSIYNEFDISLDDFLKDKFDNPTWTLNIDKLYDYENVPDPEEYYARNKQNYQHKTNKKQKHINKIINRFYEFYDERIKPLMQGKSITLYRGCGLGLYNKFFYRKADIDTFKRMLFNIKDANSWTDNKAVALEYALANEYGFVLTTECTAEDISLPFTCWLEAYWQYLSGSKTAKYGANDEYSLIKCLNMRVTDIEPVNDKSKEMLDNLLSKL